MLWFKHFSDASDDEFMVELEEIFGLDGYARWWKLCEAIAKQMKPGDKSCSCAYPWPKWQIILKGKRKKLEEFLEHLENKQEINLEYCNNVLKITMPKLLKIRDEYSKKSGRNPDNVRSKTQTTETYININSDSERENSTTTGGNTGIGQAQQMDVVVEPCNFDSSQHVPKSITEWQTKMRKIGFSFRQAISKKRDGLYETWIINNVTLQEIQDQLDIFKAKNAGRIPESPKYFEKAIQKIIEDRSKGE